MTPASKIIVAMLLAGAGSIACDQQTGASQNTASQAPSSTQISQAPGLLTASPASLYADADLSVSPDFEEKAEQAIDSENYLDHLHKIEKDLDRAARPDDRRVPKR